MPYFIDLRSFENTAGKAIEHEHSLMVVKNGFETLGVMPHGYRWRPRTRQARDALVRALMALDYAPEPETDSALNVVARVISEARAADYAQRGNAFAREWATGCDAAREYVARHVSEALIECPQMRNDFVRKCLD